jgi:hypothetical protein
VARVPFKQAIIVGSASIAYYFLGDLIMQRLPWLSTPTWAATWLSKSTATLAWFQLLNVGGALLAAAPIAVALVLTVGTQRIRLASVIGAMTSAATLVPLAWTAFSSHSVPAWMIRLNSPTLAVAISLSVPLLVWLLNVSSFSKFRWNGPNVTDGSG